MHAAMATGLKPRRRQWCNCSGGFEVELHLISTLPASGESRHTVLPLMVHMPVEVETMLGPGAAAELPVGPRAVLASVDDSSWASEDFDGHSDLIHDLLWEEMAGPKQNSIFWLSRGGLSHPAEIFPKICATGLLLNKRSFTRRLCGLLNAAVLCRSTHQRWGTRVSSIKKEDALEV